MSNLVLPSFTGFSFERKRNPELKTRIKTTASGKEKRADNGEYPLWHFEIPIGVLINDATASELDSLIGFYLAHRNQLDTWLYDCPNYNSVTEQSLGTGNGTQTTFQLRIAHPYGFIEPVHNPKATPLLYSDAGDGEGLVLQETGYTLSSTGLVTFSTPPIADAVIYWTGGYYYRCRFNTELPEFTEVVSDLFTNENFGFIGSPANKL